MTHAPSLSLPRRLALSILGLAALAAAAPAAAFAQSPDPGEAPAAKVAVPSSPIVRSRIERATRHRSASTDPRAGLVTRYRIAIRGGW